MPSAASEVTPRSAMPHGTMCPNMARSGLTLSATPWRVRRRPEPVRSVRTPTAAILRAMRTAGVEPHARVLVLARRPAQAEVGQRRDDDLLQPVHVRRPGCGVVGHRDDRVGHQLARTVVRDVAAAVGPLEHRADGSRVDQHVALVGMRPQRVGVRVLQDQQVVVGRLRRQCVLERVRLVVGNRPERPDAQHRRGPRAPQPSRGCPAGPRPWPGTTTRTHRRPPGGPS